MFFCWSWTLEWPPLDQASFLFSGHSKLLEDQSLLDNLIWFDLMLPAFLASVYCYSVVVLLYWICFIVNSIF